MKKTLSLLSLIFLLSCGGSSSDSPSSPQEQQSDTTAYRLTITPLGSSTTGTGTISLNENQLTIHLEVFGSPALMTHKQGLLAGVHCERGSSIMKLDGDLSGEAEGSGVYPIANSQGHYTYTESVLWEENPDLSQYHVVIYGNAVSDNEPVACGTIERM